MNVIVDGYNYLRRGARGFALEGGDWEADRQELIGQLGRYSRVKGSRVIVVFDGHPSPMPAARDFRQANVRVVFSAHNEADARILQILQERRSGGADVVTNDRTLQERCRRLGATVTSCADFERRLSHAQSYTVDKGIHPGEEATGWTGTTQKKGNGRRPPRRRRGG